MADFLCPKLGPGVPSSRGGPEGRGFRESAEGADGPGDPAALQEHLRGPQGQSESVPAEREIGAALGLPAAVGVFWTGPIYQQGQCH